MATLTLNRPSPSVKPPATVTVRDGWTGTLATAPVTHKRPAKAAARPTGLLAIKTVEQTFAGCWPQADPDNAPSGDTRDPHGTSETRHHWLPEEIAPAGHSLEARPDEDQRIRHSDPMLGEMADRAGYLDATCVDEVAAYARFHITALFQVMDPFLIGDRNQAAEEMADALTATFWRKANRFRNAFQRANADLADLQRAWTGDDEIQIAKRQELEDKRDEASSVEARFDLLFQVAEKVHATVTGGDWQPPTSSKTTQRFAEVGAAAAAYINGSVSGPAASATTRVFITGDGHESDISLIVSTMDKLQAKHSALTIYTGTGKGVEAAVRGICKSRNIPCIPMAPNWDKFGKKAGFERNRAVFAEAKPTGVVVIGGGGVQAHVLQMAEAAGVKAWIVQAPTAKATA